MKMSNRNMRTLRPASAVKVVRMKGSRNLIQDSNLLAQKNRTGALQASASFQKKSLTRNVGSSFSSYSLKRTNNESSPAGRLSQATKTQSQLDSNIYGGGALARPKTSHKGWQVKILGRNATQRNGSRNMHLRKDLQTA